MARREAGVRSRIGPVRVRSRSSMGDQALRLAPIVPIHPLDAAILPESNTCSGGPSGVPDGVFTLVWVIPENPNESIPGPMPSGSTSARTGRNAAHPRRQKVPDPAVKSHPGESPDDNQSSRLCQRTAIWIAAVWLGPMSVSAAAEEKAAFPVATPESQGVSAAAVRRVAGEVEEYVKNGTIVGGELLIIKNRKTILHEVYGGAIAKTNEPWSAARSSTSAR